MRIIPFVAISAVGFVASLGLASDVAYRLGIENLPRVEEPTAIQPPAIKFADRVWSTPGVEQTSKELLPPQKFDLTAPRAFRIRIEAAEDCRDVGLNCRYPHGGPEWLDDVAWPLTRELYGLGFPASYEYDSRKEFTFSGIVLQR
jgi:hypothetical protein